MTEEKAQELREVFDLIKKGVEDGNVIYETEDGMFSCPLEEFVTKSPQEIIDLLEVNLDKIFERAQLGDDGRFVNDIALANILCHYRENWRPK